ncbi:UDP-N-acetylglucosamine--N-acetylmuramyl-(pentapeptide) pyrophosphoryl-undecaprenol N-acetylglucosamine transferase [Euphorbia peplus]|nr:UDP-N-acetylglucosamine--N-acetylmuramyl-(pentapeptide) pyrophosphoryl-undecaprenol N-acetylglucosamine transferase [Euphorbia peplus]
MSTTTIHRLHHHHHRLLSAPHPPSSPFYPSHLSFPPRKILSCLSINHSTDTQITTPGPTHKDSDENNLRVVFAAGGTGGHITPALAIADELKIANPNSQILFIGTPESMESTSIPSSGYPFSSIPPVRLHRPLISPRNLSLPFHLMHSIIHSFKLLKEFNPDIVIGTGGYVSFPTCLAALLRGIKVVIQEQNSVPGIANYILAFFAEVVFVAYNSTVECFPTKGKCVVSGNPIRLSLRQFVSKGVARKRFFPKSGGKENAKVILVLGGSLGANAINIAFLNLYSQMLLQHKNWFIIWQTGVEAYNEMESLVRNHSHLILTEFLHTMDFAYAAADLVVSRAGAMTCSEILATGKPAILIPSPNVEEGHQSKNALLMADVAGSRFITEDELDSTTLGIAIEEILGDETLMTDMSERALKAAKPDASAEIARHVISLFETSTTKKNAS